MQEGVNKYTLQPQNREGRLISSIQEILSTPIGSRAMNRDFGSYIYEMQDKPMNAATVMGTLSRIVDAVEKYEPDVEITSFDHQIDPNNPAGLLVTVYMRDKRTGEKMILREVGAKPTVIIPPSLVKIDLSTSLDVQRGTEELNYSRASNGTYINDGFVKHAAVDSPRFENDIFDKEDPIRGLLIEKDGKNLCKNAAAAWTKVGAIDVVERVLSPDSMGRGLALGRLISLGKPTDSIKQSIPVKGGMIYGYSLFVKNGNAKKTGVKVKDSQNTYDSSIVWDGDDIKTVEGEPPKHIRKLNNGWFRLEFATRNIASGSPTISYEIFPETSASISDDTMIYTWGFQYEEGSRSTSYIPTTTAAAERKRDVLTMPWENEMTVKHYTVWVDVYFTDYPTLYDGECDIYGIRPVRDNVTSGLFRSTKTNATNWFTFYVDKEGLTHEVKMTGRKQIAMTYDGRRQALYINQEMKEERIDVKLDQVGDEPSELLLSGEDRPSRQGGNELNGNYRSFRYWSVPFDEKTVIQIV